MAGFGRTGRWFAVDHWDVVPDLMTMAKGLTVVVPAARRGGHAPPHRRRLRRQDVLRRPDLQRRTRWRCAAALATIAVYEEDGLIEQRRAAGRGDARPPRAAGRQAPARRARIRNLGLFGILELVRDRATRGRR